MKNLFFATLLNILFCNISYSQCNVGCDVLINTRVVNAGFYTVPAGKVYCVVAGGSIVSSGFLRIYGTLRICPGSRGINSGNIIFGANGKLELWEGSTATINGRVSGGAGKIHVPKCPLPTGITIGATNGHGSIIKCDDTTEDSALPIELLNFNGRVTLHNTSMLSWATASEKNNDYFSIEYADDGLQFSEIAQVKGQGDSKTEVKYQYEDTYFRSGKGYYRLRQTDFDGSFSYSPVIMLTRSNGSNGLAIYPNPVQDKLHIRTGYDIDNSSITLLDSSGRKVNTLAAINQGVSTLSTSELSPGIYYLKVVNDSEVKQYKIVKQ